MATSRPATSRKKPGPKSKAEKAALAAHSAPAAPATTNGAAGPAMVSAPAPAPAPAAAAAAPGAFKHDLRATVSITASGEKGTVRARAEWATGNVSYYVAYTSTTGEYREAWIDEELLTAFVERRQRHE